MAGAARITCPPRAAAELRRVACLPSPWVVADMDSTLIRKARGEWPGLDTSPVRLHLFKWLESGGSLLVVTSDDGHRPWRQLLGHIPEALRARVLLSTADGAALARHDSNGHFTEDVEYWETANEGCSAGLPSPAEAVEIACSMKREFLVDAMANPALLDTVSPASRRQGYQQLTKRFGNPAELATYLTTGRMLRMNAVLPRGSLVWRNQAGAPDFWHIQDVNEWRAKIHARAKMAAEAAEEADPAAEEAGEAAEASSTQADGTLAKTAGTRWTNVFVMGMSSEISEPYIERHSARLGALGAVASAAPNSVLIKHKSTNKALPLRWLVRHPSHPKVPGGGGFALSEAIAFGDNPCGNDAPLASFIHEGMPFISVAPTLDNCPVHLRDMHVGGLEEGTAVALELMNSARAARAARAAREDKAATAADTASSL